MKLLDVHAHLDMEAFSNDLDEVLENAKDKGVKIVVANGTNPESNRKVVELAENHEMVKPALGIYPNDALEMSDEEIEEELEYIRNKKPIAIGEIGLDYKDDVDREKMKSVFEKQVKLAKELGIPVIVHSRKAEDDVIELLESFTYDKIVMHCFMGSKKMVKRIIDNGWYFSIPCIVSYLQHFQMVVEMCPMNKLLTETDAPFLSPYPNVERNEPAFIEESIQALAKEKEVTKEEMANQVFMNFQRLFL